jgi:hypothetical protein
MKCPNCKSEIDSRTIQSHGEIRKYMCGSWETFIQGTPGPVKKVWACDEIKRLKQELSNQEECYWDDRPRFFRD